MKRFLLIFLFLAVTVQAATKITIPVGTTPFGPIAVTKLHKWASFSFDRTLWTDPISHLSATLEVSIDEAKTWSDQKTWPCSFNARGGVWKSPITAIDCPLPANATHIRGTAVVIGAEVILKDPPNLNGKP